MKWLRSILPIAFPALLILAGLLSSRCETPLEDNDNSDNDTTDTPADTACIFVDTTGTCNDLSAAAKLYVANTGDNTVSVVDIASRQVIATLAVGKRPVAVSVQSELGLAYVACRDAKGVWVIDTDADTVRRIVALPGYAIHITAGSDDMAYMIVHHDTLRLGEAYIGGISHDDGAYLDSLFFEGYLRNIRYLTYHSVGLLFGLSELYAGVDFFSFTPFVVNVITGELISGCTIEAKELMLSGNEEYLYTLHEFGDFFWIYDTQTIDRIDLRFGVDEHKLGSIHTFTTSCTGRIMYLAPKKSNQVSAFDLCEFAVIDTATFNAPADKIILLEREGLLIASHPEADAIAFFNLETGTLEGEISVGQRPEAMAVLRILN